MIQLCIKQVHILVWPNLTGHLQPCISPPAVVSDPDTVQTSHCHSNGGIGLRIYAGGRTTWIVVEEAVHGQFKARGGPNQGKLFEGSSGRVLALAVHSRSYPLFLPWTCSLSFLCPQVRVQEDPVVIRRPTRNPNLELGQRKLG